MPRAWHTAAGAHEGRRADATLADLITALDFLGIFAFALSGVALAVRERLDIVGAVSLATVTGLAGGIARDVLLGDMPPLAFRGQGHLFVPLVAVLLIAAPQLRDALRRPMLVFDAAGLGLFAVVGTTMASEAGFDVGAAVAIGVISASGGGVVRDVLVGRIPEIFTPASGLYVIPAAAGALLVAVALEIGIESPLVPAAAAFGVFFVRLLSIQHGWSTPRLGGPGRD